MKEKIRISLAGSFLPLLLLFFSCGGNSASEKKDSAAMADSVQLIRQQDSSAEKKNAKSDSLTKTTDAEKPVLVNTFGWTGMKTYPEELSGCGCAFSAKGAKFDPKNLLCVFDFDSVAVISLHGKTVRLYIKKTNREKQSFPGKSLREIYSNGTYTLEINVTSTGKTGDEVEDYEGTATLRSKGEEVKMDVMGNCGC